MFVERSDIPGPGAFGRARSVPVDPGVSFVVPLPAHGKERPRFDPVTGRIYNPEGNRVYESAVADVARLAMRGKHLLTGPVLAAMHVTVQPPASWDGDRRAAALRGDLLPTVTPDVDNGCKSILDACNHIVYSDDRAVTTLLITRVFGPNSQTECRFVPIQRASVSAVEVSYRWDTPAGDAGNDEDGA